MAEGSISTLSAHMYILHTVGSLSLLSSLPPSPLHSLLHLLLPASLPSLPSSSLTPSIPQLSMSQYAFHRGFNLTSSGAVYLLTFNSHSASYMRHSSYTQRLLMVLTLIVVSTSTWSYFRRASTTVLCPLWLALASGVNPS